LAILPSEADEQATTILENVCAVLDRQSEIVNGFCAYSFGSVLAGGPGWSDVDILLVATVAADCDRLRQALDSLAATVPLHVTIVLRSEFDELGAHAWGPLHELMVR